MPNLNKVGYLYFIESEAQDAIKIGFSENMTMRLANLQTGNPAKLRVMDRLRATLGAERRLHELLNPYSVSREWYDCPVLVFSVQDELHAIVLDRSDAASNYSGDDDLNREIAKYVLSVSDIEFAIAETLEHYSVEDEWSGDTDENGEPVPPMGELLARQQRLQERFGLAS